MKYMRDIDRAMEWEITKGRCLLRFARIHFSNSFYWEISGIEFPEKERGIIALVSVRDVAVPVLFV